LHSRGSEPARWRWIAAATLISAALEVLLVRALPGAASTLRTFRDGHAALTILGEAVFNLTFLLAISGLIITASNLVLGRPVHVASSILILALVALSVVVAIGGADVVTIMFYNAISLALVGALAATALWSAKLLTKFAVMAIAATFILSYYFKALPIAISDPAMAWTALIAGEGLALSSAILAFLGFCTLSRQTLRKSYPPLLAASFLSLAFTIAYLSNPLTTSLAVGWAFGFSLVFPSAIYPIAIFLFSFTALRLISEQRPEGYGLAMIGLAGRAMPLTYNTVIALYGMALIAQGLIALRPHSRMARG